MSTEYETQERKPVDRSDLATTSRRPAPEGAPRKLAEIPLTFRCICASLPIWARPCGGCKWSAGKQ